uniref:J domain-containing protein n=1 Tax=Panagrolaimus sp. ES5 TaxID=591445 RepID=A0AC34F085_9BILA
VFINFAHLLNDKEEGSETNEHIDNLYEAFHHQSSLRSRFKFDELLVGSAQSIENIFQSLSPSVKAKILKQIPNIYDLQTVGGQMSLKSELLAAVQLPWEAFYNIYRWYNGEISGRRASKNIVRLFAKYGGGAAGASAGATMGSFFGPVGTVTGAIIGGITGSFTAEHFAESFTEWFFDLPKTEALEIAYEFLGVHHTAPNSEINKAFRALSMRYHPDRLRGSERIFMELQYYMAIIRAARGE